MRLVFEMFILAARDDVARLVAKRQLVSGGAFHAAKVADAEFVSGGGTNDFGDGGVGGVQGRRQSAEKSLARRRKPRIRRQN